MLLQNNPSIQGADGSEYRLFTVALMLGTDFFFFFYSCISFVHGMTNFIEYQPINSWTIIRLQTRHGQKFPV